MAVVVTVVCLLVGLAGVSYVRRRSAQPPPAKRIPPEVRMTWCGDAEGAGWVSFAPDSSCFCTVDASHTVRLYSISGALRYAVSVPDATRAAVSPGGRMVMAYAHRDPLVRRLTFLDASGRKHWTLSVAGAVWSADSTGVEGMSRFVAGTGERYVYVVDVGGRRKRYRRWRVSGAVVSCAINPDGEAITLGTWQSAVVASVSSRGKQHWEFKTVGSNLNYVEPLGTSGLTAVRSIPNRAGADGEYMMLDERGARIAGGRISARERTRVLPSADGQFVCLGCDKLLRHEGKSLLEKRAVLLDRGGSVLCEKGSPFFPANPIMVTSDGFVLLAGAKNSLFTMSPAGELKPVINVASPIVEHVTSRDGSRVMLHCADGKLRLISTR